MRGLLVLALAILAGCTMPTKHDADALSPADWVAVSAEIAVYAAEALPVASSSLALSASAGQDSETPDPVALALRERGFAVFDSGVPDPEGTAHSISYSASRLDSGVLIMITLDGELASRFYARDLAGNLSPASAYSRRITQ